MTQSQQLTELADWMDGEAGTFRAMARRAQAQDRVLTADEVEMVKVLLERADGLIGQMSWILKTKEVGT